ncbi:MAG: scyllo-inosose 3-dehydrogenase [Candidatus Korarchaeota archaeon]
MNAVVLFANWDPRPDYVPHPKDVKMKRTYLGSKVWRHTRVKVVEKDVPKIGPTEVLIKVKRTGICGSDVHMAQMDEQGYIFYPGLTAFPVVLGHETTGVVVKAGERAINRRTNKPFEPGEPVTAEEMFWCGECYACAAGFPNQCERLEELGFTVDGAFAEYVAIDAKYLWSLRELEKFYNEEKLFQLGSLVEPTSVAYNAVIECGGGIRPGDNVAIFGGGPIGLGAVRILKSAGASIVILSEPAPERREIAKKLGADYTIDPTKENVAEKILEITDGMGVNLFLEATGVPHRVFGDIERVIWDGRILGATVVIVARADVKTPVTGEVFQVKKARIVGAQGHSGYATFPRVIHGMARGILDVTPMITTTIELNDVPRYLEILQTDKKEAKVSVKFK